MKRLIVILALLCACLPAFGGYAYSAKITLPPASGSADLTNYTAAVALSDATFKTTGGQIKNTVAVNGKTVPADLVFTTDATCATVTQNWEIESYDASTPLVVSWVLFSTYSHTTGPVIYACYGNAAVTTFQGGAVGAAWAAGYQGVYHMANGTNGVLNDSTSHGRNCSLPGGSANPTATTALIGGGISLVAGNSQKLICLSASTYGFTTGTTNKYMIEGWANAQATKDVLIPLAGSNYDIPAVYAFAANSYFNFVSIGEPHPSSSGLLNYADNTWYHIAGVTDATSSNLIVNGTNKYTLGSAMWMDSTRIFWIGGAAISPGYGSGLVDEVRIWNDGSTVPPDGYFATEYANLSNVAGFSVVSNIGPLSGASTVTITPIIL